MSPESTSRSRELTDRRRARKRGPRNKILLGLALVVAFGVGIALGQALHDNPHPGGQQTSLRTFPALTATSP
ncbi:MAG: hypothetical protein M3P15_04750 [Actinomycetota bacterium]|nr:hypothetical protein [Actinomycetota bacterium]